MNWWVWTGFELALTGFQLVFTGFDGFWYSFLSCPGVKFHFFPGIRFFPFLFDLPIKTSIFPPKKSLFFVIALKIPILKPQPNKSIWEWENGICLEWGMWEEDLKVDFVGNKQKWEVDFSSQPLSSRSHQNLDFQDILRDIFDPRPCRNSRNFWEWFCSWNNSESCSGRQNFGFSQNFYSWIVFPDLLIESFCSNCN